MVNIMIFKRKAYDKLLEWKNNYADRYSILLEGARRVGKSTIAEEFAKNEYDSYILIDFTTAPKAVMDCFDDINDISIFLLRLQTVTGVQLVPHRSVIIFDEIQRFPPARQAIKHLVKDGRYHYIETGSLISIKRNVEKILIPSEEMKLAVFPMDYEEFMWATGNDTYNSLRELYKHGKPVGNSLNRKLMRDFRIYMAVGGMPQAVEAYTQGRNFVEIDTIKRSIINLYEDDFKKIDPSGFVSKMYHSIPAQLSKNIKRYSLSRATGKRKTGADMERVSELIDSKTVLVSYNTTDPRVSLYGTKDLDSYKMYISDTGLFVTLLFIDRPAVENELYAKMLSDKLPANLGYLYENAVAQMIASGGRELYYHTWEKPNSTHYYEVDFLLASKTKTVPIEVKSSGTGKHESITAFQKKYHKQVAMQILLSQKDIGNIEMLKLYPIYMLPFILEEM